MRKIKFRAWDKKKKRMHEVYEISWSKNFLITEGGDKLWLTNNTILLQLTGLKDKNGKEIYEEDIIKWTHPEEDGIKFYSKVFWNEEIAGFHYKVTGRDSNSEALEHDDRWEIKGNIYENKELLK